ncbi:hypothetical protein UPYG_G00010990 [Umbra pygmaea]|uniref:FHA domain-containing protein n=1 Tax=Umbra pygmaea TaxID=75934 RepID=A0ABD0Y5X0_UMBPY
MVSSVKWLGMMHVRPRGYLKTTGRVFKLQSETTTVGSHRDSDLCLQNGGVQEHHALIEWSESEGCFVLSDLNSSHGTYVNDCRIHNAAVCLTPGDKLNFGYGGSTYQLAVVSTSMLQHPPVNDRTASQNSLQLTEEPSFAKSSFSFQLPLLPGDTSVPVAWVPRGSSVTPHPPTRPRPVSGGIKRTGQVNPSELQKTTTRSWTRHTGNESAQRTDVTASQSSETMLHLLQEKEERLLRQGDEVRRLSVFESESQRKDGVIAGLRDEVSALRHQLTMSQQADSEIQHRLLTMEQDINNKREQIDMVKEQMIELQKGSTEEFRRSVIERDLKISNLRGQMDRLKRENSNVTGQVAGLQRDLSSREKQALKLASEVDRLQQDIRSKESQLVLTATKISKMSKKHQEELLNCGNEVITLKKSIETLEFSLREKQRLLEHETKERGLLFNRLEKNIEEQERSKAELTRLQDQVEHLRDQLMLILLKEPSDSRSNAALSDQQILEKVSELLGEKNKVEDLEGQLQKVIAEQERAAEHMERLKSRLETCQECSTDALKTAMTSLQEEAVSPALTWVQTAVIPVMESQLLLLQSASQTLLESGIDALQSNEGVLGGIKSLVSEHQRDKLELQHLKVNLEELQESAAKCTELHEHLRITKEELEQKQHEMINKLQDEEARQKELAELKGELEALRQAQTDLQKEAQTQEARCHAMLQEGARREEKRQEELKEAWQKGVEEERERCSVQEAEYREQVRQHAHTIVALEQSWVQSRQRTQEVEEERDVLIGQLTAFEAKKSSSPATTSPLDAQIVQASEGVALEANTTSLRDDLAQSQLETQNQGDIIQALSRDLAAANARISDMTGELSEQQKLEMEQRKSLVVDQRVQLSILTQKLTMMSQLMEQKGEELEKVRDELRRCQGDRDKRLTMERKRKEQRTEKPDLCSVVAWATPQTKDMTDVTAPGELAKQGSSCREHRHEEFIQRQRKELSEMRAKITALEQWSLQHFPQQGASKKQEESEKDQLSAQTSAEVTWPNVSPQPGVLQEETLKPNIRWDLTDALDQSDTLDLSDALDLSERTYLDLVRALCEALELSESQMEGCMPLQHLPQEKRANLGLLRQADLELLRTRIAVEQRRVQRMETLLHQQNSDISILRESQAAGQHLQARLDTPRNKLETESHESSQLLRALSHTQIQLDQDTGIQSRAIKSHKAVSVDRAQKRSQKTASGNSIRTGVSDKSAAKKLNVQQRLKKREYKVETLTSQLGEKEKDLQ